ncbi:hypothetical protein Verru16b_02809 [Lacunisphaera limnophila]|uniref:HEAT repeat protein n=1 Tax=Lacunisphaera limnophila TaxID=1838286 RepID=A0A1D8AXV8_9BACT|nr:hypothetical protein [Lacunisphaera limnophila]AOS45722.1 hypothetical protein Verru16b_02809 [Lacunisphaera limnophila]
MKNAKLLISGLSLALTLAAAAPVAAATTDWSGWMENYYLNPEADKVVPAVYALSRSGHFEQEGQTAAAIGFLGAVFAQNPDRAADWMYQFRQLPAAHQRLVAAALWYSGLPEGVEVVRQAAQGTSADIRTDVENLMAWQQPVLSETPVQSVSSLNLQWGAFLASGNPQHIVKVLAALGSDQPVLGTQVRMALAEKALAHPRVYEICQSEIARQPEGVREQLRTALGTR